MLHNASSYKAEPCENSIHSMNHIVFRRAGETHPEDLYKNITGKVIELELPEHLEDISSTKIRENIDNNRDISNLIDPVVQEYIYNKGIYLREPEFKPILRARAIAFETAEFAGDALLDELEVTVLKGHPEAESILARLKREGDGMMILRRQGGALNHRALCP